MLLGFFLWLWAIVVALTTALTPTPTPTPTPVPYPESIVCVHDWDCATAMRVVDCETGGTWDPGSLGIYDEIGWFQIHPIHFHRFDPARLSDPAYNTACAWELYAERGWVPWYSSYACWR